MSSRNANVLLVEDSDADCVIVQRALEDAKIQCDLATAPNGAVALARLRGATLDPHGQPFPLPDLILLDINMPLMNGFETLTAIRNDRRLVHLPVVMLTTSDRDRDVFESYRLGVNAYLTKPVDELAFMQIITELENFWFRLVTLPPRDEFSR